MACKNRCTLKGWRLWERAYPNWPGVFETVVQPWVETADGKTRHTACDGCEQGFFEQGARAKSRTARAPAPKPRTPAPAVAAKRRMSDADTYTLEVLKG